MDLYLGGEINKAGVQLRRAGGRRPGVISAKGELAFGGVSGSQKKEEWRVELVQEAFAMGHEQKRIRGERIYSSEKNSESKKCEGEEEGRRRTWPI